MMKRNYRLVFTTILLAVSIAGKAQFYQDIKGNAIKENTSADVEGSPYLSKDWADGSVTVDKGVYKDLKLKYDLKDDAVIFAGKDNAPMNFSDPVKRFSLNGRVFANGFPVVGPQGKNAYYEVLSDGKTKLLKHYVKHIQESKTYGSAAVNREYVQTETYFVFNDGKMIPAKADRKTLLDIFADKTAQLDAYAKANKINFKKDTDLGKLVDYYNSL
ncbi:hypothetical protein HQ865_20795 [Mucilaginibacter mali]|uniref:DKNYY family protein n=1 Tax=Mucilaginibacter mali TaxID=2740462 RepID=A0A7D4UCY4_9SPHI|nr:hypothetical protein [Mucilaginibacter mali]QKJ32098.1 hypothetical protein HQ865_20795 [Mucilaginibacter mali]